MFRRLRQSGSLRVLAVSIAVWTFASAAIAGAASAASFDPATFDLNLRDVASGFARPVFLADPGDGSGRLFVVEQGGTIHILRGLTGNGGAVTVDPEPFLDLRGQIATADNEQGLLGLAFSPNFANDGELYVGYTALPGSEGGAGNNTVARFHIAAGNPNQVDPASEEILISVVDPFGNHNGGNVMFGPDGYLYAGLGDGGAGGDPFGNGQNPHALLGSLLRLDVTNHSDDVPYTIPPDNPFADGVNGAPEVWAYGLRNPWRFSFDRASGDVYIGDVGQNRIEEIDMLPDGSKGGANFGWNVMEGTSCYAVEGCDPSLFVPPVAEYTHEFGCSVTGGYVYRGDSIPALDGVYLFGDYCTGLIWGLGRDADGAWRMSEPIETGLNISSFAEDANGTLYAIDLGGGIYRIEPGE
ncbi:MAG: PQQ-dependent sugar dehydrogenase [Thermomicrobiales bacterium]|nr:PQQ-dependent sugar dehydrogenase [Thermomicrobiales bacterium]